VTDYGFENFTADQLRQYMQQRREKDFRLVDVRQPEEYSQGHIPGARLKRSIGCTESG
jgi:rhodanese-related sulfurtransferase